VRITIVVLPPACRRLAKLWHQNDGRGGDGTEGGGMEKKKDSKRKRLGEVEAAWEEE
jgi:hypothetical protein